MVPVVVISLTFAMFYKLVPNTKVHFGAALADSQTHVQRGYARLIASTISATPEPNLHFVANGGDFNRHC